MDRAGDSPLSPGKSAPGAGLPQRGKGAGRLYIYAVFFLSSLYSFCSPAGVPTGSGEEEQPGRFPFSCHFIPREMEGRWKDRPFFFLPSAFGGRGPGPPACAPVGEPVSLRITAPGPPSGAFPARPLPFIPNPAPFLGGVRVGRRWTGRRSGFFRRVCSCSAGKTVRPGAGQVLLLPAGEEGAFCASGPGQRLLNSFSPEFPFFLPPKKGFSACALLYLL